MRCPKCGAFIRDDSKFCNYCGEILNTRESAARPIITSRPREEIFDVATTVRRDLSPDMPKEVRRPVVIAAIIAATVLLAAVSLIVFTAMRRNQRTVVNVVTSPIETESTVPTTEAPPVTEETEPEPHSIEDVTKTDAASSETPAESGGSEPPEETGAPETEPFDPYETEEGGLVFRVEPGKAVLLKSGNEDAVVYVPAEIDGQPVRAVAEEAFIGQLTLQRVCLREGVRSIGARAFKECLNLKEVVIPDSVSEIGEDAFLNADFTIVSHTNTYAYEYAGRTGYDWREGDALTETGE